MKRREFLKISGMSAVAASCAGLLDSCRNGVEDTRGRMTYRINPGNDDSVSILGYGCMRWPVTEDEDGNDVVDQEMTNALVDYALEHGINNFDAAPMYHHGECEKVTGSR